MKGRSSADDQTNCNILKDYSRCNFIYVLCEYSVTLLFMFVYSTTYPGKSGILARIRNGGSVVRIPVKARYVPHFKNAHTASGAHADSYSLGIGVLYRR
jgi:hypothetical protein